jgi:hypothetical protein
VFTKHGNDIDSTFPCVEGSFPDDLLPLVNRIIDEGNSKIMICLDPPFTEDQVDLTFNTLEQLHDHLNGKDLDVEAYTCLPAWMDMYQTSEYFRISKKIGYTQRHLKHGTVEGRNHGKSVRARLGNGLILGSCVLSSQ